MSSGIVASCEIANSLIDGGSVPSRLVSHIFTRREQAAIHDYLKSVPRSVCKNLSSVAGLALLTITFLISDLKSFSVLQVISWVFVS